MSESASKALAEEVTRELPDLGLISVTGFFHRGGTEFRRNPFRLGHEGASA